jgi:CheY-like chemotaxis protein
VLRIEGRAAAVSDPGVPGRAEKVLSDRAAARDATFVVLDGAELEGVPAIGFYAAVRLGASGGGVKGTLAVLDDRPRRMSEREQQLLIQIAGQLTRSVEIEMLFEEAQKQRRRMETLLDRAAIAMYVIDDPDATEEPADQQETADLPQKLRVLLVEDDEAVASGLCWSLEEEGMDVHLVTRGADVSQAVSRLRPDVMVLDLHLPDEEGRTVYERVAAQGRLPVVFSSGHASEREIDALLENPNTAFLMKPYSVEELLRTIHRLVEPGDVPFEAGGEFPAGA